MTTLQHFYSVQVTANLYEISHRKLLLRVVSCYYRRSGHFSQHSRIKCPSIATAVGYHDIMVFVNTLAKIQFGY